LINKLLDRKNIDATKARELLSQELIPTKSENLLFDHAIKAKYHEDAFY
jgi:hypothetical protein